MQIIKTNPKENKQTSNLNILIHLISKKQRAMEAMAQMTTLGLHRRRGVTFHAQMFLLDFFHRDLSEFAFTYLECGN